MKTGMMGAFQILAYAIIQFYRREHEVKRYRRDSQRKLSGLFSLR